MYGWFSSDYVWPVLGDYRGSALAPFFSCAGVAQVEEHRIRNAEGEQFAWWATDEHSIRSIVALESFAARG
jgi:hypothetical protein